MSPPLDPGQDFVITSTNRGPWRLSKVTAPTWLANPATLESLGWGWGVHVGRQHGNRDRGPSSPALPVPALSPAQRSHVSEELSR